MTSSDYFGNTISVGDWVALSMESHTALTCGKIVGITVGKKSQKISVSMEVSAYNKKFNRMMPAIRHRRPHNVIKMEKTVAIEKILLTAHSE